MFLTRCIHCDRPVEAEDYQIGYAHPCGWCGKPNVVQKATCGLFDEESADDFNRVYSTSLPRVSPEHAVEYTQLPSALSRSILTDDLVKADVLYPVIVEDRVSGLSVKAVIAKYSKLGLAPEVAQHVLDTATDEVKEQSKEVGRQMAGEGWHALIVGSVLSGIGYAWYANNPNGAGFVVFAGMLATGPIYILFGHIKSWTGWSIR